MAEQRSDSAVSCCRAIMGFMMLLVIGVVVIIALKIAHIPRSPTVSALAGSTAISIVTGNHLIFLVVQGPTSSDALCSKQ